MCPWEPLGSTLIAKRGFDNSTSWAPGHSKEQNLVLYQHAVVLVSHIPNEKILLNRTPNKQIIFHIENPNKTT